MNQKLVAIKVAALASTDSPKHAACRVNGHEVVAVVAEGYRNTGKPSIRWRVDGKVCAEASLEKVIA